jgi:hypothetical protein
MPTFYFHLRDGADILIDPDGIELAGLPAIVARALTEARSIIGADALDGHIDLNQRIDVEDASGALVHRLEFANAITMGPMGPTNGPGRLKKI